MGLPQVLASIADIQVVASDSTLLSEIEAQVPVSSPNDENRSLFDGQDFIEAYIKTHLPAIAADGKNLVEQNYHLRNQHHTR